MKTRNQLKVIWSNGKIMTQAMFHELFDSIYIKENEQQIDYFITGTTLDGNNLILTRNDGVEIEQDLSSLTFPDYFITGTTLDGNNLILTRNDGVEIEQDLSSLTFPDYFITGTTLSGNTLILTRNDGVEIEQDLSSLSLPDYYVTGATLSGNNLILTRNDDVEIEQDLSNLVLPDYYVTGATLDGNTLVLTRNDGVEIEQDLSSLILPDYYVTGATLSGNTLILTRNDGVEIEQDLSGLNLDDYYVTGTTLDGNFLILTRNDGVRITQDLSTLSINKYITSLSLSGGTLIFNRNNTTELSADLDVLLDDIFISGGTYDLSTGNVVLDNSVGDSYLINDFISDYTNKFIINSDFNNCILSLNRNDGVDIQQELLPLTKYSYHSLSANTNDISLSGNDIVEIGMDDYSYSALTFSNPLVKNYTLLFKHIYAGYPPFTLPSIKNYSFTFNSFIEDTDFYTNLGTGFNGEVKPIVVQSDGKTLVGGGFVTFNGVTRNYLVRLNADGTEDTAFNANLGAAFNYVVNSIVIQSDGKILVGGGFNAFNGATRYGLVRLNADGTEDTDFYSNLGTGFAGTVNSIAIQSDGKILVGGTFTTFNGQSRNRLVRLNADGTEDAPFYSQIYSVTLPGFNNTVNSIVIQSDGSIWVGGAFTKVKNVTRNRIVKLNSNGTPILGGNATNTVNILTKQSDGKILVGGNFTTYTPNVRYFLVRLNADGTEDTAFYTNLGTAFNNVIYSVAIQSDGKILVGGVFTTFNGVTRNYLVRLNADGTEDTDFYSNLGTAFNSIPYSVVIQSDEKILVGGTFTSFNDTTRNYLVRLNAKSSILNNSGNSVLKICYVPSNYIQLNG